MVAEARGLTPRYLALMAEARRRASANSPAQYIPHTPHPQQAKFLALDCLEALYGGAAGGGKSDALLMAALQYVHVPGYSALLLRRTYADLALPGAIMDRASSWLATTAARWNGVDKRWTFPSGATLSFGYMDTERDRYRYQGAELQFIGFDELTQFPEKWYRYMFSRLRKLEAHAVPTRMRAATNPGGLGHEWVKRRFIDPEHGPPFVPAKLADNPSVDQANYLASLAQLDTATRAQLLDGVWIRDSDGLVYSLDDRRNIIDAAPSCPHKVLALDFGFTDATGFAILGWRPHDPAVYALRAWTRRGMIPSAVAEEAQRLEREHAFEGIVGDIGGLGKGYAEEARQRFALPIHAAEKNNKRGYISLLNGELERGLVKVVGPDCRDLLKEWRELPWNEDRSKEADGFDNHAADAVLYGWRRAKAFTAEPPPADRPKPGTREAWEAEEQRMEERLLEEAEQTEARPWWEE